EVDEVIGGEQRAGRWNVLVDEADFRQVKAVGRRQGGEAYVYVRAGDDHAVEHLPIGAIDDLCEHELERGIDHPVVVDRVPRLRGAAIGHTDHDQVVDLGQRLGARIGAA